MKDIAAEVGVSLATVSAVIGSRATAIPVSDKTRKRVLEAAKRLNYQVNDQARALRQGRSNTILIAADNITEPFAGMMLGAVSRDIQQRHYHFLVSDIHTVPRGDDDIYLKLFMQRRIDGILFLGISSSALPDGTITRMVDEGIPVVMTEREIPGQSISCALVDNLRVGAIAAEHLIEQGCHRILHIAGPSDNIIPPQRRQGYRETLEAHDVPWSDAFEVEAEMSLASGYTAMQELLPQVEPGAGVFAFNDMIAVGAMRAIRRAGLSIPADVAVVGCDDIPIAAYAEPPLSTVSQPVNELCEESVRMLLEALENPVRSPSRNRTVLQPSLVVRESSLRSR